MYHHGGLVVMFTLGMHGNYSFYLELHSLLLCSLSQTIWSSGMIFLYLIQWDDIPVSDWVGWYSCIWYSGMIFLYLIEWDDIPVSDTVGWYSCCGLWLLCSNMLDIKQVQSSLNSLILKCMKYLPCGCYNNQSINHLHWSSWDMLLQIYSVLTLFSVSVLYYTKYCSITCDKVIQEFYR